MNNMNEMDEKAPLETFLVIIIILIFIAYVMLKIFLNYVEEWETKSMYRYESGDFAGYSYIYKEETQGSIIINYDYPSIVPEKDQQFLKDNLEQRFGYDDKKCIVYFPQIDTHYGLFGKSIQKPPPITIQCFP